MNRQLIEIMRSQGDAKCIIIDDVCYSYQDVVVGIEQWITVFSGYGIASGAVVAIEGIYSLERKKSGGMNWLLFMIKDIFSLHL